MGESITSLASLARSSKHSLFCERHFSSAGLLKNGNLGRGHPGPLLPLILFISRHQWSHKCFVFLPHTLCPLPCLHAHTTSLHICQMSLYASPHPLIGFSSGMKTTTISAAGKSHTSSLDQFFLLCSNRVNYSL